MKIYVKIKTNNEVISFLVSENPVIIGRGDSADIKIADNYLSSQHFSLLREGNFIVAKDLDSKNGTFIDGVQIEQAYLVLGAVLSAGKAKLAIDQKRTSPEIIALMTPTEKERTSSHQYLSAEITAKRKLPQKLDMQVSHEESAEVVEEQEKHPRSGPNLKKLKQISKKQTTGSAGQEKSGTLIMKIFEKFVGKK